MFHGAAFSAGAEMLASILLKLKNELRQSGHLSFQIPLTYTMPPCGNEAFPLQPNVLTLFDSHMYLHNNGLKYFKSLKMWMQNCVTFLSELNDLQGTLSDML